MDMVRVGVPNCTHYLKMAMIGTSRFHVYAMECTVLEVRDSNLGPQVGLIAGFSKDTMVSETQADEHSLYYGILKFPGLQTKLL